MFAEDEAALLLAEPGTSEQHERRVRARLAGRPLEHVLGWASFAGLRIVIDPGVFVRRRRTELLVRLAVEHAAGAVVVDLCCGSGAIAAAVRSRLPSAQLWAADVDPAAGLGTQVAHDDDLGATVVVGACI